MTSVASNSHRVDAVVVVVAVVEIFRCWQSLSCSVSFVHLGFEIKQKESGMFTGKFGKILAKLARPSVNNEII